MSDITSGTSTTVDGITYIPQRRTTVLKCDGWRRVVMRRTIEVGFNWVRTGAWK